MKNTLRVKDEAGRLRQFSVDQAKHEASAMLLKGKPDASLLLLAKAVQFAPRDAEIRFLLGESEVRTGGLESGIYHLQKAVEFDPGKPQYHAALGQALKASSPVEAARHFQNAIALGCPATEPYIDLASILLESGKPEEAIEICEKGLNTCGESPMLLGNKSVALYKLARYEEALASVSRQLQLEPASVASLCNLCGITRALGRLDDAERCAWQAIRIDPNSGSAHYNLAVVLLLGGKYRAGFEQYEWRWKSNSMKRRKREFSQPLWDGSPLAGRTLFVYSEQGSGDAIQFSRFLPLLPFDGRIVVGVPSSLKRLIGSISTNLEVVDAQPRGETFHVQCPLLTLPFLFKTESDSIPAPAKFVIPADIREKWESLLNRPEDAGSQRRKIGLVWAGNPTHENDRNRSIPLNEFTSLLSVSARFFSFQMGPQVSEMRELGLIDRIKDLSPLLTDYLETAAALLQMDLLISVDTSVVHLAGSLGIPVWILVPFAPDWRWQLHRVDSPWYATLRLFRQKRPCDWPEAIKEVCERLAEFCDPNRQEDKAPDFIPGARAQETVVFLSGQTRGATLEGIGRSLRLCFNSLGLNFVEISLVDNTGFTQRLNALNFEKVKFVFSFASMGAEVRLNNGNGKTVNVWQAVGVPFISIHGDSPAYFFDRHVMLSSNFVSLYAYREHYELRRRLPHVNGLLTHVWPVVLDAIPEQDIDWDAKKNGKLIFLKNGKDPARLRQFWASCLDKRLLEAILAISAELQKDLDSPNGNQIDDVVTNYFSSCGFDTQNLTKLRLFFIAQLDDYLRAVKATAIVEALLDFPVEIRGNNWRHIDFTGRRATYIDECDYVKSIGLIRGSLGIIDMSPNTDSYPHDRVMRSFGSHTLCLTNRQEFLSEVPDKERINFRFEKTSIQDRISDILDHPAAALELGIEVARAYTNQHPSEQGIQKLLDCASLVKLNNLPRKPAGSQEFFCWPPASV